LGTPPEWNPTESDQEKEFNKWKTWSSKKAFISKIENSYRNEERKSKAP